MSNTAIITVRWRDQINSDLQIPLDMNLAQLLAELIDIYDELPKQKYTLYFVTKAAILTDLHCTLRQCHISNGDILRLMEAADDSKNDLSI